MVRALPYVVPIALALFALIDLSRSAVVERAGIHPAGWVAIIVLLPVVGPIAWIAVSRSRSRDARAASAPGPGLPRRHRPGPVAPDDDPDFLRGLDRGRRPRDPSPPEAGTGSGPDAGTTDEGDDGRGARPA